jgi:GrpB-like predicted nucleotidyltransferase (UPF0157 family)
MRVRVVDHDPEWPRRFAEEAARVKAALGDTLVRLHHVGSTSVPGLAAKPIIDMLAEVTSVRELDASAGALEALGYEGLGEYGIPGRRYFRKGGDRRTHQIHAFRHGGPEVRRHLALPAYLRAHPEEACRYAALKRQLAARFPEDIEGYMNGKDAFVKALEQRALAWWDEPER